jgi:D-alanine-D-alanine ligase
MLTDKKIAVLMGGPGSERQVSLASGNAVLKALQQLGLDSVAVDLRTADVDLPAGIDLVFNVIHGTFGEDGQLQEILDARGIPYTGAGAVSSRLAFDKQLTKKEFVKHGVPTPWSELLDLSDGPKLPSIGTPFVVKPLREGSSVGVHIVRTPDETAGALADDARYGEVLVEEFIAGKELTVGILDGKALPIVHISPPAGVYDMASKYPWLSGSQGSEYFCPADLDEETTRRVQAAALEAHRATGVEIYSRVDVLLDPQNNPYVLEVNTIPGMTETSLLPKAAAAAGISFPALCEKIAALSLDLRS